MEELPEAGLVGKVQMLCDFGNVEVSGLQQPRGFHQQHLVDVVHHGFVSDNFLSIWNVLYFR